MSGGEAPLTLAFRLARRELRGGLSGFRVFIACLALGVAIIAGVGSVSAALTRGLAEGGQDILGGDIAIRLIHREATREELAFIADGTQVSMSAEMRAMARGASDGRSTGTNGRGQTLVELKSIDNAYPLYGIMDLDPPMPLDVALAIRDGHPGLAVEPNLLTRLGVHAGDLVRIGNAEFQLRATIVHEPDRVADGFALGPRAMISAEALALTGLVQPGSLVNYHYRVRLPDNARSAQDIAVWVAALNARFPDAGWRVQDRSDSAPGVRRFVERVALFLSLVGLTALVVGGVGVANAVKSYLDGKRGIIATFKCLGAPGPLIFRIYLIQVMALAVVGIAIGLAIGGAAPFIVEAVAGGMIPIPTEAGLYAGPLVVAAAYGVLTALAFAIWPLARARDVPAAGLFRDIVAPVRRWPRPAYIAAAAGALFVLAALAVALADEHVFALWFVAAAAGVFVLLWAAARGIMALAARTAPRIRSPELRLALANIHRPGAPTSAVVLSLGLGLTLLVAVSLINGNLSGEITRDLPARAPAFFFVDIQPDQIDALETLVRGAGSVTGFQQVPMLRGKIAAVNGVLSDKLDVASGVQWALRGDRGITYSAALPAGSVLARGAWWPEDYSGPPLVSFGEELAQGFGLSPGDTVTVNVLGREIKATVANTREIDWTSLGINFVMVFSPGLLSSAPHTLLATVDMDGGAAAEEALESSVTSHFPNVTSVRVREALEAVNTLLKNFSLAVRATGGVTLAAGILVLGGAMAAGFRSRVRDAVLLKVLGATRMRILAIYVCEYALLGLATAIVAALAGTAAAWAVIAIVMDMPWRFLAATLALTVAAATFVTIGLGLLGTWRALSAPSAPVLRAD
tara:strand:- start:6914 stop:9493 length:2580 start_codon:yes stop_codon:yes gene_type:complete